MAQSLFTGQIPVSQDTTDGIVLMLGTWITPSVDGTVTAVRFRFPETVQPAVKAALFRTSDSVKVSGTDVTFATPALDDWNEVALPSPVLVQAGVTYCPAVRITRYCITNDVFPLVNGDLSAAAHAGHYSTADPDGSVTFPNNESDAGCYFVDLVFTAAEPAEGEGALGFGLAVAAQGARDSRGSADAGIGLAVAASGSRAARGSAALTLALAPAAEGLRAAGGAAALGLNLSVVARGSNGDAGRPVAAYPWTPRPVRSFSEVMAE